MANEVRITITGKDKSGTAFKSAESRADKFKGFIGGVGKVAGGVLGAQFIQAAGTKLLNYFNDSTEAAGNLNEALNKSNVVFGKNAKGVERWATGGAKAFGLSKRAALEAAGSFGNMFNQLGFGLGATTKMSKSMIQLASDFASFHNADISDVIAAQEAAFRGEYDAVQRFVPTINAARVETEALKETGKKNADSLTDQEKAMAAYTLMVKGAGKAQGDFARTSDEAANKQRILAAKMENTSARIGAKLLPLKVKISEWSLAVVNAISKAVNWISDHAEDFQSGFIMAAQGFLKYLIIPIVDGAKFLNEQVMRFFGIIIHGAANAFGWVPGIGPKLRKAASDFDKFQSSVNGALDKASDAVHGWDDSLTKMKRRVEIRGDIKDLQKKLADARKELTRKDLNKTRTAQIKANIAVLEGKLRLARAKLKDPEINKTREPKIKTDIRVLQSKLAIARGVLKDPTLTRERKSHIKADIRNLQRNVTAAKRTLALMQDKTVHIYGVYHPPTGGRAFMAHGGISGAQGGGPRSRRTWVGERGPELLDLPPGTRVWSNEDSMRMARGAGGGHVVVEINLSGAPDELLKWFRKTIRVKGGNVQAVLGS